MHCRCTVCSKVIKVCSHDITGLPLKKNSFFRRYWLSFNNYLKTFRTNYIQCVKNRSRKLKFTHLEMDCIMTFVLCDSKWMCCSCAIELICTLSSWWSLLSSIRPQFGPVPPELSLVDLSFSAPKQGSPGLVNEVFLILFPLNDDWLVILAGQEYFLPNLSSCWLCFLFFSTIGRLVALEVHGMSPSFMDFEGLGGWRLFWTERLKSSKLKCIS